MSVDISTFWLAVNDPIFVPRVGVFCYLSRDREREREKKRERETVLATTKPFVLRQPGSVSGTFRLLVEANVHRVEKYSSQHEPRGGCCVAGVWFAR
jgi:hypothetical protein